MSNANSCYQLKWKLNNFRVSIELFRKNRPMTNKHLVVKKFKLNNCIT